jgi:hypothetical protein
MPIIRIISFALFGFFLALGISYVSELGYLERWKKLTLPSVNIQEYLNANDNHQNPQGSLIITNPCDFSKPEFSILSNYPKNISKCVQLTMLYAEGEERDTFILDENGAIWEWSFLIYVDLVAMIIWPCMGLLIGVLIAIYTKRSKQGQAISSI